ncbi:MAG: hypothetical protein EXS31_00595 [Pedosphaera sp.]|nr:hypothetical protein [Pedosphaera sp.]
MAKQWLISPQHAKVRRVLRTAGPIVLVIGILFTATAFVSFLGAMGGQSGPPKLFGCGFVGLPLMFVGSVLCMFGFMGSVTRYAAAEQAPVAADTLNYLSDHTQEGVKTFSKAVAQGVVEGMRNTQGRKPASEK